jgi:hypothetical protein
MRQSLCSLYRVRTSGSIAISASFTSELDSATEAKKFVSLFETSSPLQSPTAEPEKLSTLRLSQLQIRLAPAKLTKKRIVSLQFHPHSTAERTLLCASDTLGEIGFLCTSVRGSEGEPQIFRFQPHQAQASCLQYHPVEANKLFSASYDGLCSNL